MLGDLQGEQDQQRDCPWQKKGNELNRERSDNEETKTELDSQTKLDLSD